MEKHNIHITFEPGAKTAEIKEDVWQYDFGQTLQISGLSLPPVVEVHYANKGKDTALPQTGVTEGGITTALIPNEILEEKGVFTAYIFVTNGESGETCYTINGYVNKRPPVKDYSTPEDQEILHAAVGAVNAAAERAESAETKATEAANQAHEDAAQTSKDREAIKNMVDSVAGIDEQVKKVEECTRQSQEAATQAGEAKEEAVSAKSDAEKAAQKTAEDKTAVELAKTAVDNAQQAVRTDRTAVESVKQSVEQLGNAIPEATQTGVQAVDQAKQTAVNEINQTGNTHKTAVEAAGTKAVENVENVKQTATKAIQTEGTTQTANVTTEGAKQLTAVREAAQEIVADREQVKKNKADIAGIKEEMNNFSSAIINSATGESIVVEDSSGNKFKGLNVYGKSTQVTTTGAQLLDVQNVFSTEEKNGVTFVVEKDEIVINGTATANADLFSAKDFLLKLPAGEYTFSIQKNSSISLYLNINSNLHQTYNGVMTAQITPDSKIAYFIVRVSPNVKFNNYRLKIMLNEGSAAKPWEPYTGGKPSPSIEYAQEIANTGDNGNVTISIVGSNICNFPEGEFQNNGITYISKKGAVEVKGKTADSSSQTDNGVLMCVLPKKIKGVFYLSGTTPNVLVNIRRISIDGTVNYFGKGKFDLDGYEKEVKVYIRVDPNKTVNETIYPMVNVGDAPLPFEPYKPAQTLTIPTPNGLPGIKVDSGGNYTDSNGQQWVCDEVDLERGKYIQKVAYETIDKSALNIIQLTENVYKFNIGKTKYMYKPVMAMSNFAKYFDWANSANSFSINKNLLYYTHPEPITAEEIKKKFNALPVIEILGQLETPIEHDLPPEVVEAYKKLHTNYPVTTVLNDAGAGMKVEYVADTKHYIDKKFEELNAKVVSTQIALL